MNGKIPVLDHGYVQYIEHYGSDERIIEAARMSTGKGFKGWGDDRMLMCPDHGLLEADYTKGDVCYPYEFCMHCFGENKNWERTTPTTRGVGDEKLLRYLYEHKHNSPFEFAGLVIEVQAPIFVFREWHRHRTQSYNEMSARYTPLPDVNYIPTVERILLSDPKNRQSTGLVNISQQPDNIESWLYELRKCYERCQEVYQFGLDIGVPKELARLPVPVARYSRMRASANLRNWLLFLTLRMDNNAQYEIRQFANTVGDIISKLYPRTWELFIEGVRSNDKG